MGARAGGGTEQDSQKLPDKVTTARLPTEARSGRAPPSGPGADPALLGSRPPSRHIPRGRRGRDAAEPTLTFEVEAETRGAPWRGVLEGRSDAQHNRTLEGALCSATPFLVATCERLSSPPLRVFIPGELGPDNLVFHINWWFYQLSSLFSQTDF